MRVSRQLLNASSLLYACNATGGCQLMTSVTAVQDVTVCRAGSARDNVTRVCELCAPGTITDADEQPACTNCSKGTYQPTAGASACRTCELGHECPSGSAEMQECRELQGSLEPPQPPRVSAVQPCCSRCWAPPWRRSRGTLRRRAGARRVQGLRARPLLRPRIEEGAALWPRKLLPTDVVRSVRRHMRRRGADSVPGGTVRRRHRAHERLVLGRMRHWTLLPGGRDERAAILLPCRYIQ
jgi:hypothetical protein